MLVIMLIMIMTTMITMMMMMMMMVLTSLTGPAMREVPVSAIAWQPPAQNEVLKKDHCEKHHYGCCDHHHAMTMIKIEEVVNLHIFSSLSQAIRDQISLR